MSDGDQLIRDAGAWAALVPGLVVSNLARSVDVYTRLLGFELGHSEPDRLAVCLHEGHQLILSQQPPEDAASTETVPLGRGVTLNVRCDDPKQIYERLRDEKYPIAIPMEIAEFSDGDARYTQSSFVVADPDGYLLRFSD